MNFDFIRISLQAQISLGIALLVLLVTYLVLRSDHKHDKKR